MEHKSIHDLGQWFQPLIRLSKEHCIPLLSGLIAGFLAHFSVYANKFVNHDDVYYLFEKGASATSGRWGLDILTLIFPNYSMPWIYGVITLLFIICSGCIILRILQIRTKFLQILLMCLLVSFPSLTAMYSYMFTCSSYGFSFFLSVLSVYCLVVKKGKIKIFAFPLLVLSLSIYQAYLSVAASLLLITVIRQALNKETTPSKIWLHGLTYFTFLLISLLLYYLSAKLVLSFLGLQFNNYANINSLVLKDIFLRVIDAYYTFFYFFTRGYHGILNTFFLRFTTWFLIALSVIYFLPHFLKATFSEKILLLFCGSMIPLCINFMYLITEPQSVHTLVVYSFVCIYFLLATVLENSCGILPVCQSFRFILGFYHHIKNFIIPFILIITTICNIYLANEVYLRLHLSYENTYAFYSTLCSKITNNPDFDHNTKIALIGTTPQSHIANEPEFENVYLTGSYGMVIKSYAKEQFVKYYLGMDLNFASDTEINNIIQTDDFSAMENYPYHNSICKIDQYLVVKLSDPTS